MWYTTYIYYHILYYYIEWNGWNGRCDCFKCEMWLTRKKSSLQTYAFWASCALSRLFIPNRPNDQTLFGWENTSPDNVVVGDRTSENQKKKKQENMCWMDNRVWVSQPRRKWEAKNKGGSAPRTHTTHRHRHENSAAVHMLRGSVPYSNTMTNFGWKCNGKCVCSAPTFSYIPWDWNEISSSSIVRREHI